jgi:hypothetical protein
LIGGGVAVVVIGAAAWAGRNVYAEARIGTTYVAKQTCSCLFVAHRSMDSCKTDYAPKDIEPLAWETRADSVTVSALGGMISAKSIYEDGFGCHPVD